MALSFNLNLTSQGNTTSRDNNTETAGSLASNNAETAGSLACSNTGSGLIANNTSIDQFVSSNPFAPQIDYSKYESVETAGSVASNGAETAGSLAFMGAETAGSLAFTGAETAGSLAFSGAETAGSVAFSDSSSSFSSFG